MRSKQQGPPAVYDLKAHLVWITKYRHKVLTKEVEKRVRMLVRQTCDARGLEIISEVEGRTSRKLQEEFPHLRKQDWGRHVWAIGYGAFSSGHVTDDINREYIKKHREHVNHQDDDFPVEWR